MGLSGSAHTYHIMLHIHPSISIQQLGAIYYPYTHPAAAATHNTQRVSIILTNGYEKGLLCEHGGVMLLSTLRPDIIRLQISINLQLQMSECVYYVCIFSRTRQPHTALSALWLCAMHNSSTRRCISLQMHLRVYALSCLSLLVFGPLDLCAAAAGCTCLCMRLIQVPSHASLARLSDGARPVCWSASVWVCAKLLARSAERAQTHINKQLAHRSDLENSLEASPWHKKEFQS